MIKLLDTCNHELIHQISYQEIFIKGLDYYHQRIGFDTIDRRFGRFNEAITEITNREIIIYYWKNWPELSPYTYLLSKVEPGGYIVTLVDWLIMEVAERNNKPYRWLLDLLQLDMFLGSNFGIEVIARTIGYKVSLLRDTRITKYSQEIELAKTIGIPGIISNLTDFANGVKKPYLEGLEKRY